MVIFGIFLSSLNVPRPLAKNQGAVYAGFVPPNCRRPCLQRCLKQYKEPYFNIIKKNHLRVKFDTNQNLSCSGRFHVISTCVKSAVIVIFSFHRTVTVIIPSKTDFNLNCIWNFNSILTEMQSVSCINTNRLIFFREIIISDT